MEKIQKDRIQPAEMKNHTHSEDHAFQTRNSEFSEAVIECSPYERVGGVVYFTRMVEKMRLRDARILPEDYIPTLGRYFDMRCCSLFGVSYEELATRVRQDGITNQEAFDWAIQHGNAPSEEGIEIWNEFLMKRGWRDEATPSLRRRLKEIGADNHLENQTIFDCIDFEEGRPLHDPTG